MKTVYENDYVIVMDTSKCACSLKDGTYLFQIPLRFLIQHLHIDHNAPYYPL